MRITSVCRNLTTFANERSSGHFLALASDFVDYADF